jgi:hypothetical protein
METEDQDEVTRMKVAGSRPIHILGGSLWAVMQSR